MSKRIGKKILRIGAIVLGSLVVLLTAFHFWVVHHAEELIQDLVASRSNGHIRLEVRNFKFNWFSKKMELEDAVFVNTDSATTGTSNRFAIERMKIRVTAVWPIIFDKKVLIDHLELVKPDILVTRLRGNTDSGKKDSTDVSLPQEMGKIYKSIQDAIDVLQVKKFELTDATFTLVNRMHPDEQPIRIGHIDFNIDNLRVDTTRWTGKEKILFSDNISLKSRNQDILFPDKRHRLSYRNFRINIQKQLVEFDSCTIAALKTDSSSTSFSIYCDRLQMTNIDFDTLYRAQVIKADSVYCINPRFELDVNLDKRKAARKKAPQLEQIIKQLTGDLQLNYVVVNNASFAISTLRNDRPSSFTSAGNNFEMQGLRIDNDAERPLKVDKFAMAIRNYENFLRDSTYEMQFDSILFNDNRILLHDFSFRQLDRGKTINHFKVPRFELTGLSWDDLLFEQKLTAREAILFNPVIDYTEAPRKSGGKKQRIIFDALADINQVIMLDNLSIENGDIRIRLNGGTDMHLEHATLSVESRALLGSSQLSGIRRSVNYLDFSKGFLRVNDVTLQLKDISYTGNNSQLEAEQAVLDNDAHTLQGTANGISANEIFINENTGDISIGKVSWANAGITLNNRKAGAPGQKGAAFVSITDINGGNTKLMIQDSSTTISANLDHIRADAFLLKPGQRPIVSGLVAAGSQFHYQRGFFALAIPSFDIADKQRANVNDVLITRENAGNAMRIGIKDAFFVPDIQAAIAGSFLADDMTVHSPELVIRQSGIQPAGVSGGDGLHLPLFRSNKIVITQPLLRLSSHDLEDSSLLFWNGLADAANTIVVSDVQGQDSALHAGQVYLSLNHFTYRGANGKAFDAGKGEVTALLNDISLRQPRGASLIWDASLASLDGRNFMIDSMGKNAGNLDIRTVALKDLRLESGSVKNLRAVLALNSRFRLQQVTGSYADSINHFEWYNAGYDKNTKQLTLDSFSYRPAPDRETYIRQHPYQEDYITIRTGAVMLGSFDVERYLEDSVVRVQQLLVKQAELQDFRDNRKPFREGVIKPLTVNRVRAIPFRLAVDSVLFEDARVLYSEINPKNGLTGTLPVRHLSLGAFNVRNTETGDDDSLYLRASGVLMDSLHFRLSLRESYADSLAGFLLTAKMDGTDARQLNPVLVPLAAARIRSGWLDSLQMRVSGNEYRAMGEMQLLYRDLRIDLFRRGTVRKAGFLSFLANTLIKNKNTRRAGTVFFVRDRERSSLNYLIKILMSGVKSSTGVKTNRKAIRAYKKEWQHRNLPAYHYD